MLDESAVNLKHSSPNSAPVPWISPSAKFSGNSLGSKSPGNSIGSRNPGNSVGLKNPVNSVSSKNIGNFLSSKNHAAATSKNHDYVFDTLGRKIPPSRRRSFHSLSRARSKKKRPGATSRRGTSTSSGRGAASGLKMAIKLHRCPHCEYTNTSLKLVRGHMVKHGPYRIQCGYCDYKGHYPSRIRKHTKRHHPRVPFRCKKLDVGEGEGGAEAAAPIVQVVQNPRPPQKVAKPPQG
jgi:hypothetical protein